MECFMLGMLKKIAAKKNDFYKNGCILCSVELMQLIF